MNRIFFFILFLVLAHTALIAHENEGIPTYPFIENKGQWHQNVNFKAGISGGNLYLEKNCFTYHFYSAYNIHPRDPDKASGIRGHNFKMNFLGSNQNVELSKGNHSITDYNYFYGNDPEKWVSAAKAYDEVYYKSIYDKIDLSIYAQGDFIKYDYLLAAEADPNQIRMQYEGASDIRLENGKLVVNHSLGMITELKPYAYQIINGEKQEVACEFVLKDWEVSFHFPDAYDHTKELIIDPTLIFSTFSGSISDNWGMTATYDKFGNAYNGGTVFGPDYITTVGAYDTSYNSVVSYLINDVAITKYSADGSQMLFSTYLGGSGSELVHSMIVNYDNELMVVGVTGSSNFPTTTNAYDTTFNGGNNFLALARFSSGTDIYVTKFNSDGSALLASTFLGGSGNDGINYQNLRVEGDVIYEKLLYNYGDEARGEINLDKDGNIYIASATHSTDFPTVSSFDDSLSGYQDAIVAKFSSDLSDLLFSTYLGGSKGETGVSVKVDALGTIFVGGGTNSTDFPSTSGAYEENYNGGIADGYITKMHPDSSSLLAATYIGTSDYDQIYAIEVDRFGDPYFFAQSKSGLFPVINAQYNVPNAGQLVGKMNNTLDSIIYSTTIGNLNGNGNIDITPTAFLIDRCQNIYISGWGGTISDEVYRPLLGNMPITSDAFKNNTHGRNFYIAVIERNAETLMFGTYFGGNTGSREHVDGGTSRFDQQGIVYQSVCAGCAEFPGGPGTSNFPTKNALYPTNGNTTNCNNAIFKFDLEILPKAEFTTSQDTGCAPLTVHFNDKSLRSNQFIWDFGNGDTTSMVKHPTRTFNQPGRYLVKLGVTDSICQSTDTAYKYIVVFPEMSQVEASEDTISCSMDSILIGANSFGLANSFLWSNNRNFSDTLNLNGDSTIKVIPKTGNSPYYYLKAGKPFTNCNFTDSVRVQYIHYEASFIQPEDTGCSPFSVNFKGNAIGATNIFYNFGDGTTSQNQASVTKNYTEAGTYSGYFLTENSFCNLKDSFPFVIHVFQGIELQLPPDTTICLGDSILLSANTYGTANEFIWSNSADFSNPLNNSSDSTIIVSPTESFTPYYFKASNELCSDSSTIQLSSEQVLVDIELPKNICEEDTFELLAIQLSQSSTLQYRWEPDSLILTGQNTDRATSSPSADATYSLYATSAYGCMDTANASIKLHPPKYTSINIEATDTTIYKGQTTHLFTDLNDPNLEYTWTPADHLSDPFGESTDATPPQTTDYWLSVYDTSTGCTVDALLRIIVYEINCGEPEIFIPTAFTPNNDQNNDLFLIKGNVISEIELSIYNRWGEKVFETQDLNIGWNGKYQGMQVDPGVFVYHLRASCFDGQTYFKKGNVTLIR